MGHQAPDPLPRAGRLFSGFWEKGIAHACRCSYIVENGYGVWWRGLPKASLATGGEAEVNLPVVPAVIKDGVVCMADNRCSCSGGGLVDLVVFWFVVWAWLVGVPTPWGVLELDLFPPAIRIERVVE